MISVLATDGQTVFTVQGGYIINHISVFRNGVRLSPADDFTAGDGSTVTLNDGANVNDRIDFHIFDRFTVQNAIIGAASTQTINGDLVLNGKLFGALDVPSINLTGIITATELDLNGKGDISSDLNVVGVTTIGKQIHVGTGVSIAAGGLNVTAGITTIGGALDANSTSNFGGNLTVSSGNLTMSGAGNIVLGDSGGASDDRIVFGAGSDLAIYHNGSSSYIEESGTGELILKSNSISFTNAAETEHLARFIEDGAVSLYHNGSVKLQTTSTGTTIIGDLFLDNPDHAGKDLLFDSSLKTLKFDDGVAAKFGTGSDLSIYHNGTHSFIQNATNDLSIECATSDAAIVLKANHIHLKDEADQTFIKGIENTAAVELYYGGTKKFETTSDGATVSGKLTLTNDFFVGDNVILRVGSKTSTGDLQIFHNGTNSFISNVTGILQIDSDDRVQVNATELRVKNAADSALIAKFIQSGACELYHNGTKRFNTLSNGCEVQGRLGVGDGTDPETSFQVTATAAGAQYPVLLKNRTNGGAAVGMRFIASGSDLSDGDFASIEAGHATTGSTNHEFRFKTCHSGTVGEKLRITSSGDMILSSDTITTGHAKLTVAKEQNVYNSGGAFDDPHIRLETPSTTDTTGITAIAFSISSVDNYGYSIGARRTAATGTYGAYTWTHHNGSATGNIHMQLYGDNGHLILSRGSSQKLVWGTNDGVKYSAIGRHDGAAQDVGLNFFTTTNAGTTLVNHFRIDHNGNLLGTDTSISSISDSRVKTDITNYTYDLAKFKQFTPKQFNWKNPAVHGDKTNVKGFLAQDLEAIDSQWVDSAFIDKEHSDYDLVDKSVDGQGEDVGVTKTSKFGDKDAMYVSVINQLIAKIETLETKVAALEGS